MARAHDVKDRFDPDVRPSQVAIGVAGLFLPFVMVMLVLLVVGKHSIGEKLAAAVAFVGVPLIILGLQRAADRERRRQAH